ncbi:MAG: hypothetical protein HGB03_04175 [Candidatus Yonathbacteria bacterium]|nr:hypothetical protein [Candidatus Yonathbacteria bacterium]NTW47574.1 hypothetical protein [Candidatus Yonathbacteria bacterium]
MTLFIISLIASCLLGISLPLGCTYISRGEALIYWKVIRTFLVWTLLLVTSATTGWHAEACGTHVLFCLIAWSIALAIGILAGRMFSALIRGSFISLMHYGKQDN